MDRFSDWWFPIGLIVAFVILVAYLKQRHVQFKMYVRGLPHWEIGKAPEGADLRIRGLVRAAAPCLLAPISGRPCVYYEVTVEEAGSENKWHQIVREVQGMPFLVEDSTGHALVDATGAVIWLNHDVETSSGFRDDATLAEQAFLARHQQAPTSEGVLWTSNRTLRYSEAIIEPGETVVVAGRAVREPDPDGAAHVSGYRDAPPTRLRLTSSPRFPLHVTDRAGDV